MLGLSTEQHPVETELRYSEQVIYTEFTGRIHKEQVCSVIREWSYLLHQTPTIHCAVFDFSNAHFQGHSRQALLDIAVRTHLLNSIRRDLKVMGICPSKHEYLLAKHWAEYAVSVHSIDCGQVDLYRSKSKALSDLKELTSHGFAPATHISPELTL
ncbi:MAG: hypothetical protein ACFHVJ_09975 [Aestuariibacter sp.]